MRELNRFGLTSVIDAGGGFQNYPEDYAVIEELHRSADAIAAWKSLLARYPGSVYAERARARLDHLNERR